MAASTISPAVVVSPQHQERRIFVRLAGATVDYWHLLSLDAPTVAVVWTLSFAAALHVHLPILGPAMLALATWLLYVADRLLDAAGTGRRNALQTRHYFHQHHRRVFLTIAAAVIPLLAWLVATRLDPAPLREDLVLAGCSLVYLVGVHFPPATSSVPRLRMPKELIVGIIFAAACVIPTWSRAPLARPVLLLPVVLFAGLCWVNCVAIEYWEALRGSSTQLHRSTLWIGNAFNAATSIITAIGLTVGALLLARGSGHSRFTVIALYFSIAVSSGALGWLHRRSRSLDALRLRAAADAVLLTPAIVVPCVLLLARGLSLR